jgi:hypothetical protein
VSKQKELVSKTHENQNRPTNHDSHGSAILPHLKDLVKIIKHSLQDDEQQEVKTITALALTALAEAATLYGIKSFNSVLNPCGT